MYSRKGLGSLDFQTIISNLEMRTICSLSYGKVWENWRINEEIWFVSYFVQRNHEIYICLVTFHIARRKMNKYSAICRISYKRKKTFFFIFYFYKNFCMLKHFRLLGVLDTLSKHVVWLCFILYHFISNHFVLNWIVTTFCPLQHLLQKSYYFSLFWFAFNFLLLQFAL